MKVLLAFDRSDPAKAAVEFLKGLRFVGLVELEIVAVLLPMPTTVGDDGVPFPLEDSDLDQEDLANAEEIVRTVTESLANHFHVAKSSVRVGTPGQEIVALADEHNANLIVIGAVGHSGLRRVLLGSVAEYVAHHAKASTLVVRLGKSPRKERAGQNDVCRVLVALENSPQDRTLIASAEALQFDTAAEVHLVHVMPRLNFFRQDLRKRSPESWADAHESAKQHVSSMRELAENAGFSTRGKVIEATHVGESLIEYAEKNHCDVVVTGDRGHSALDQLMLGSTSRFVLRHTSRCVLVVKERHSKTLKSY